jgi:signal transduction histidine kinase
METSRTEVENALAELNSRHAALIEAVGSVVVEWDMRSGALIYQRNVGSLLGDGHEPPRTLDEWATLVHPEDRARFDAAVSSARSASGPVVVEYRLRRKDGAYVDIEARGIRFRDATGDSARMVGFLVDVSQRKAAEAALRSGREELESVVAEGTARVQALERERAVSEQLAATGRMAARVAHEINNSLAGIKSSFLLVKDAVAPNHRYFDYVGRIESEIAHIALVVRQIAELYRPNQGEERELELREEVEDVTALLESTRRKRGVELRSTLPRAVRVVLPEGFLRQIVFNLAQNALDASPRGGLVEIIARADGEEIQISVFDEGEGIAEDDRERVFTPFFTTKRGNERSGLGLGLCVSRSLVRAMGGILDFRAAPGGGTEFFVRLPRRRISRDVK